MIFLPHLRPDGTMARLVGVGWTLNYEMFFYSIFAVAVLAPRRYAALAITVLFVVIV